MLIASKSMDEINRLKAQLSRTFDMKDLGAAKHILGMEIHRDRKNGNLMYAMVSTRPDISHAVGVVNRFMANPGEEHWRAVKWVLQYLRGTSDHCIIFNGGAISWMPKLQETVVLSTIEEKYITTSDASKEAIWLKGLLHEIGRMQEKVNVLCDSQSAIHLATKLAYHSKTKHIDVMYHFLRHVIDSGKVALKKVHSRDNCADIFTKPITVEMLRWCLASLGLQKR
eukprot:PITA_11723